MNDRLLVLTQAGKRLTWESFSGDTRILYPRARLICWRAKSSCTLQPNSCLKFKAQSVIIQPQPEQSKTEKVSPR